MTLTYDDLITTTIKCDGENCEKFSPVGPARNTMFDAHAGAREVARAAGWTVYVRSALCPTCVKKELTR